MAQEIERKFLIDTELWKPTVKGIKLLQVVAEESTDVFKVW